MVTQNPDSVHETTTPFHEDVYEALCRNPLSGRSSAVIVYRYFADPTGWLFAGAVTASVGPVCMCACDNLRDSRSGIPVLICCIEELAWTEASRLVPDALMTDV